MSAKLHPVLEFIQPYYNKYVRPYAPGDIGIKAGVPVCGNTDDWGAFRVTDLNRNQPWYKQGLIDAIHEQIQDGDSVSIVGFGRGVSTVHAHRAGGDVTGYEAAKQMIDANMTTLEWQGIRDDVTVVHGVVGDPLNVYGDDLGRVVSPSEAAECDVLVMDCEGAEASILDGIREWPRCVIVESHPPQGTTARGLKSTLSGVGYDVHVREYEPGEDRDGKAVVVGVRE